LKKDRFVRIDPAVKQVDWALVERARQRATSSATSSTMDGQTVGVSHHDRPVLYLQDTTGVSIKKYSCAASGGPLRDHPLSAGRRPPSTPGPARAILDPLPPKSHQRSALGPPVTTSDEVARAAVARQTRRGRVAEEVAVQQNDFHQQPSSQIEAVTVDPDGRTFHASKSR
jgi:hypothetical protein